MAFVSYIFDRLREIFKSTSRKSIRPKGSFSFLLRFSVFYTCRFHSTVIQSLYQFKDFTQPIKSILKT